MDVPRSRAVSGSTAGASSSLDVPGASTSQTSSNRASASSRTRRERERSGRPKDRHALALRSIRDFLRGRSSYDVLPVSFRLIVLDTKLVVKPALDVMWQAGVVSAPLWQSTPPELLGNAVQQGGETAEASTKDPATDNPDNQPSATPTGSTSASESTAATSEAAASSTSEGRVSPKTATDSGPAATSEQQQKKATEVKAHQLSGFAGMLTVNDIIHLIQYYYHHSSYDSAAEDVEKFRLERLRDIEQALNVPPPPLLSVHPLRPLYDACRLLIKTHARRLPLLDYDEQTGMETVVSVLTQYRVLKFIAMNCRETSALWRSLRQLGIGTYCHNFKVGPSAIGRGSASAGSSHRGSDASEPGILKSEHGTALSMSEIEPEAVTSPNPAATGSSSNAVFEEGGNNEDDATRRSSNASNSTSSSSSSAFASRSASLAAPASAQPSPALETDPLNPFAPLATATLDTTVFDVVHMFSERGISAVPILDEEGNVVDMYETVDVITLVRTGAYTSLDLTIRQALERRPPDFSGVWTCSPDDSLASIFALLRKRRVHRLLVLQPEPPEGLASGGVAATDDSTNNEPTPLDELDSYAEDLVEEQKQKEKQLKEAFVNDAKLPLDDRLEKGDPVRKTRGKLVGMVCLSDILRHVIGEHQTPLSSATATTSSTNTATPAPHVPANPVVE